MHRNGRLHDGVPAGKREAKYPACLMKTAVTYFLYSSHGECSLSHISKVFPHHFTF